MLKKKKNKNVKKTSSGKKDTSRSSKKRKTTVSKRSKAKLPALEKRLYSRIKQEYFDLDYINKLSPKQQQWLNKFMNEHLNANMNSTATNLHRSKKMKRACYSANNARNRDVYSIAKATGRVDHNVQADQSSQVKDLYSIAEALNINLDDELMEQIEINDTEGWYNPEDALIQMIDNKRSKG